MLTQRNQNHTGDRHHLRSSANAVGGSPRHSLHAASREGSLDGRLRAIAAVSLWIFFSAFVVSSTTAQTDLAATRSLSASEFDAMLMAWFAPLPQSASVEIFTKLERPRRSRDEWEKRIRKSAEQERADGRTFTEDEFENWIRLNVEGNIEAEAMPRLTREKYLLLDDAVRLDSVDSGILEPVSPSTPFFETIIQPGDLQKGDTRAYGYYHPNPRPESDWPANSAWRTRIGSAYRTDFRRSERIKPILEDLLGVDRVLLEVLAAEVCELPKPPLTKVPEARELPLDPKKIEALLADKGGIRLRVSEFDVGGEKRIRIRILSPPGWGLLGGKEFTFAEVVVKADDFRAVYEQRLFDTKGAETVVVTADGFDDQGIPKEKTWVRRRPDGQHETTSYAILNAKVNIDIPAAEFEFNPPEGYLVDVMGPDGRPIKSDAPPPPAI
ncbi:MAG: hypothetical protein RLZZ326_311, partial [Planctomycetota bacterium]